jgi:hypothetical protein
MNIVNECMTVLARSSRIRRVARPSSRAATKGSGHARTGKPCIMTVHARQPNTRAPGRAPSMLQGPGRCQGDPSRCEPGLSRRAVGFELKLAAQTPQRFEPSPPRGARRGAIGGATRPTALWVRVWHSATLRTALRQSATLRTVVRRSQTARPGGTSKAVGGQVITDSDTVVTQSSLIQSSRSHH